MTFDSLAANLIPNLARVATNGACELGNYLNPVSKVDQIGRRIEGGTFGALNSQLKEGEALIGLYDRCVFKCAPHLPDEREFLAFADQIGGGLRLIGYYAVDKDTAAPFMDHQSLYC